MGRSFTYIIIAVVVFIVKWIWYFIDEAREKKGLPSRHREYLDSLSGGDMDFVNFYTPDEEVHEVNEKELKDKYNFTDRTAEMDVIETIGEMPPKEDK